MCRGWMKITSDPGDSLKYQVLVTKHNQHKPLSIQIASTNSALINYVLTSETHNFGYHIKIEEPLEVEFLH